MNFLYYNMRCEIQLGKVKTNVVNSIQIDQSIKKLTDTAVIQLPRNLVVKRDGQQDSLEGKKVRDFIKVGDRVQIKLGYDDELKSEFTGYITKIGADAPLVIHCEDEMWQLKQNKITKSYKQVKLLTLLQDIAPGYEYEVIDNISLGKFRIDKASAYEVLSQLQKKYGLFSRFTGKVLHVGFPVSIKPSVKHPINLNRNVRAQRSDLKFVSKDDLKVMIKAISLNNDGSRLSADFGDKNGAVRTLHFTGKTLQELKELAEKNYKSLSFDGFQGKLPTWGLPRIKAGDAVSITDPAYNGEHDGTYLNEAVQIKFNGSEGFKRENTLSMKL